MRTNKSLYVVLAVIVLAQGVLHGGFLQKFWGKNYSPGKSGVSAELSPDQIILQLFGFREFLAGILWVRADGFFDQGNYDAVLPIIRLCTILDPKQIDVYATGMWHIGYNFTDEDQRSDRRYVPSALALGKEGARQNPNTYEMFFETGWMWYHKIDDDYHQAVRWFQEAGKRQDILPARRNLLTQAYFRNGQVSEALDLYYNLLEAAEKRLKEDGQFGAHQQYATVENNLDTTLVRMVQRGWIAQHSPEGRAQNWYATGSYDTKPPFDVGFSAKATVLSDRVIRFEGTWNVLPIGTRVRVVLRDADYPRAKRAELDWDMTDSVSLDPPRNLTYMQDQLFVRNRRFNRKVDMSKDPTMYPFLAKKYIIEFYYNPRSAPPHIQDKFGYSGEGFTDSKFRNLEARPSVKFVPVGKDEKGNTTEWKLEPLTGLQQPVMYTSLEIDQDMVRRKGEWVDKTPVLKTANYREPAQGKEKEDIIMVPTLRAGANN
jgi:tetratricopeptide (TPR) repeat protein